MTIDKIRTIVPQILTRESFSEFGDVIELGDDWQFINDGMCKRHNDLAQLNFDSVGQVGISLFDAKIRTLPYEFRLMERHPLGSQAFLPLCGETLLLIVALGSGEVPGQPEAFTSIPSQGVNIHRGVWHGVLTPLSGRGLFAVVDWIGEEDNLQTYQFEQSYRVVQMD